MSARRIRLTPLRRHLAAIITVSLSVAFVAVAILAGQIMVQALGSDAAARYRGVDLVASTSSPDAQPPHIPEARAIWPAASGYGQTERPDGTAGPFVEYRLAPPADVLPLDIARGHAATGPGEVVLEDSAARALHADVGQTIAVASSARADGSSEPLRLRVTGVTEPTVAGSLGLVSPRAYVAEAAITPLVGPDLGQAAATWNAVLPDGADAEAVARSASSSTLTVRTGEQVVAEERKALTAGFASLGVLLAAFVGIALFTGALVISTTFAVTLAQRTRSLALLRTVGASRRQVRAVAVREAIMVGGIGSLVGVVLGHAVVQAALIGAASLGWIGRSFWIPVSPISLLVPLAVGLVLTLLASALPIRRATRVAPMQALRPVLPTEGRTGRVRTVVAVVGVVLGAVLMAGGVAASLAGSTGIGMLAGLAGGVISFCGVLAGLPHLVGPLSRLAGRSAVRLRSQPARLAASSIGRNRSRSAATVAALLIGSTLMTMMAVGARTVEASLTRDLDSARPIDIVVTGQQLPEGAADTVTDVAGVADAVTAPRIDIDVHAAHPMTVTGVTPEQITRVSRRADLADTIRDGQLVMGEQRATDFGLSPGQTLRLPGADGTPVPVTVVVDGRLSATFTTPATLRALAPQDPTAAGDVVLARLAAPGAAERADRDGATIVTDVEKAVTGTGASEVSAQAPGLEREMYGRVLAVLLGITVALLAVSVAVAVVGVAGTLGLGVIERTGENALLRALGATRGQMRATLGWEGILLALFGALLGLVLGTAYGLLGAATILGGEFGIQVALPWTQLAALMALTLAAGWAASVLPGARAARTAPAAALARADG